MDKKILTIGFMLFAIFFGAGNLIFPAKLGFLSGTNFWPAIIGFIITGVGMPIIGIVVGALSGQGYMPFIRRISPLFASIFMIAIYLTIGPLFAIPRTATVTFEMGILPLTGNGSLYLFITSFIYFAIALYLSLNPGKMVGRIGDILTPLMLIFILLLVLRAFFLLGGNPVNAAIDPKYSAGSALGSGFIEGYQTMDTIASIAFIIVVLEAVKSYGVNTTKELFVKSSQSGLIAGICLALVYLAIGWMGNHYSVDMQQLNGSDLGTFILVHAAKDSFSYAGQAIIGIIVTLACLTTAVGLIVAISNFFQSIMPRFSYKTYAYFFTLISFILANQGLELVITRAIPVLLILYPVTIVIIALLFIDHKFPLNNWVIRSTATITLLFSILAVFKDSFSNITDLNFLSSFYHALPYSAQNLGWIIPAITIFVISAIISLIFKRQ